MQELMPQNTCCPHAYPENLLEIPDCPLSRNGQGLLADIAQLRVEQYQ